MTGESHPPGSGWLEKVGYSRGTNNIDEVAALDKSANDYPLCFHWTVDRELFRSIGLPLIKDRHLEHALISILTEAVIAYEASRSVSYSRRHGDYTGMGRYHGWKTYTYRNVTEAVAIGVEHGFLTSWIAPRNSYGKLRSTFTATPKLAAALAASWARHELKGIIRLKNAARELVPFDDTDFTRRLEREMGSLNEFLASIQIDASSPDVVKLANHWVINDRAYRVGSMAMYRVFNRNFKQGGRLYNGFQNVPKTHRARILLNGEPTVNLDVRQLHAAMLYDQLDLLPPEDAYSVDGYERDEGKLVFNVGVNCEGGRRGTVSALLNKRNEKNKDGTPQWARGPEETKALVDAVWEKNEPVQRFLGSGAGRDLMNDDSKFMIRIIKGCQKADIPLLPIHDGMQVPASKEGQVLEIVEAAASRTFNNPKACVVRVTGQYVPQIPPSSLPPVLLSTPGPSFSAREAGSPVGGLACLGVPEGEAEEHSGIFAASENLRPIQTTFIGALDDKSPELEAVADILSFEGGIVPETVIRIIRDQRKRNGVSQERMARALGISRPQLANAERQRFGLGREPAGRLRQIVTGELKVA